MKTQYLLGSAVDLNAAPTLPVTEQEQKKRDFLLNQSIVLQNLESLVLALNAMEEWKTIVNEFNPLVV